MSRRPAAIDAERVRLVALVPSEIEALIANDQVRASKLAGVHFPPGWPDHPDARNGLPWHLDNLVASPHHAAWRIRVVVERGTDVVIGAINLKGPPDADGDVEIGWGICESHRRRGLAVEATAAVMAWALAQPGVTSVSATVPDDNVASQRVAAKLGMIRTGEVRRELPLWRIGDSR